MKANRKAKALILSSTFFPSFLGAATLTLDDYLGSVKQSSRIMKIATTTIEAGELRATTPDLIYTPQFFSQAAHTVDEKQSINALAPEKIQATNLSFGVQKLWESGLQTQVSYQVTRVNLDQPTLPGTIPIPFALPNPLVPGTTFDQVVNVPNPARTLLPPTEYTEARTQLDLVQPLWKNSGGRDYGLTRDSTLTKITMQELGERYKVKSLVAQAEFVYWQLALAEEAVRTQEGSIERFRKLKEWARGRAQSQLGDKADLLQADSGLKVKLFELEAAKKDRSSLRRIFNTLRGQAGEHIEGTLVPLSGRAFSLPKGLAPTGKALAAKASETNDGPSIESVKRLDVEIAKQAEKLSRIEVEQSREKYRSQLDAFGTVAFNALEETSGKALTGSLQNEHPTYIVGLRYSTPLDSGIIDRDRAGLIKSSEAARLDREQKEFTAQQDWADLQAQLNEAHVRLDLAEEIEKAQAEKLAYERQRLSIGRTTTYQIIMFEQDYASAQLVTIKSKADILGIVARLKSFGDAS